MLNTIIDQNYEGCSVIIGCPSVGNVGQLALDAIISTLNAEYIGMIWHEALLPFTGPDPFDEKSKKLCSSNDFYYCKDKKLILVQLRVPLCKQYQSDYLHKLLEYFQKIKVKRVFVLSGLFAHRRDDTELLAGAFRYISCPKSNGLDGDSLQSLGWARMKGNEETSEYGCPKLPGGGFTREFFNLCKSAGVPCVSLLYFCSEGDNVEDAIFFTKKVDEWLGFMSGKCLVQPPSWKYLFGNDVPRNMY